MNKSQRHKILRLVEIKYGKGRYNSWKNKDFEDLSFSIHQQTKVLISVATLKRLYKKVKTNESYSPQENTLKALIAYGGYTAHSGLKERVKKRIIALSAVLIIIAISVFSIYRSKSKNFRQEFSGNLLLQKTEGKCPTTAFFEVEIPELNEPVFIRYGDSIVSIPLSGGTKLLSHFYAYPGYFKATLQTKTREISEPVNVLAESDGWNVLAHYFNNDYQKRRYYPVSVTANQANGFFYANPKSLSAAGIDTSNVVVIRIDNFRQTNVSGDDFVYKTHMKNTEFWPGIRCFSIFVSIVGTQGKIQFKFVGEGCSSYSEYIIGEKSKTGSNEDLSKFVINTHQWLKLNILNENKNVSLSINDSIVFSDTYNVSIGDIVGTSMVFHGNGRVDYIHLLTPDNKPVFYGDFNE